MRCLGLVDDRDSRLKGNFRTSFTLITQKRTRWLQKDVENCLPVLGMHQEVVDFRMNSFLFRDFEQSPVSRNIYILTISFSYQMVMRHTKVTMNRRHIRIPMSTFGINVI